jgi:hypothetical protein
VAAFFITTNDLAPSRALYNRLLLHSGLSSCPSFYSFYSFPSAYLLLCLLDCCPSSSRREKNLDKGQARRHGGPGEGWETRRRRDSFKAWTRGLSTLVYSILSA